jgi:RimJ/RimL family protein N-acetyltransferase
MMKKEIMSNDNSKIDLLPVLESDWDYILHLNQQFVKNYHVDSKPTKKQDHYNYMKKQKTNPNFHQWMIGLGEKKVGHVRILENDVGIMVDSKYQNKGISTIALQILEKKAKKLKIKKLVGVVRIDNLGSEKIFQKNNYEFIMKWYEKKII